MSTYVKRPIEVEATQWFKLGDHPKVVGDNILHVSGDVFEEDGFIGTLEGVMRVRAGDWIITGIKGEYYPCKDEIFKETYQEVLYEA